MRYAISGVFITLAAFIYMDNTNLTEEGKIEEEAHHHILKLSSRTWEFGLRVTGVTLKPEKYLKKIVSFQLKNGQFSHKTTSMGESVQKMIRLDNSLLPFTISIWQNIPLYYRNHWMMSLRHRHSHYY